MRLALNRRRVPLVAFGVAVVLGLAGCGSSSGGSSAGDNTSSSPTRTVTDVVGDKIELPVDPERVVALDEPSALNLAAMGITPDIAFQGWKTVVPAELLESLGVEMHTTAGYYPELEEVAALDPDLIVISANPEQITDMPDYASIAPTLRAEFSAPASKLAQTWGGYFDDPERAKAIEKGLSEFAGEIADQQPSSAQSLSVLQSYGGSGDSGLYYMDGTNSLAGIIAEAGFTRPELQAAESADGAAHGGWAAFSPERLADHDASIIALTASTLYSAEAIEALPLYEALDAVEQNQSVVVDGDFWAGGSLFYTYWVLTDLHDFAPGDLQPGGSEEAAERWDSFSEMIEG